MTDQRHTHPGQRRDTAEDSDTSTGVRVVSVLGRVAQASLAGVAFLLVIGSLLGGASVITFAAIALLALVLLAFVFVIEAGLWGLRRWAG